MEVVMNEPLALLQPLIRQFECNQIEIRNLAPTSVRKRKVYLERFLEAFVKPDDLGSADALARINVTSLRACLEAYDEALGHGSRLDFHRVVRAFLGFAARNNLLERDLSVIVPALRPLQQNLPKALPDDAYDALLKTLADDSLVTLRDRAIILLLADYGVRGAHVRAFKCEHVNWRGELICFPPNKGGCAQYAAVTRAWKCVAGLHACTQGSRSRHAVCDDGRHPAAANGPNARVHDPSPPETRWRDTAREGVLWRA